MRNVLVVGSGAREHAIVWKLKQSNKVGKIFVCPGNAGTKELATNIPWPGKVDELVKFAKNHDVYLTVVGPDNFLADGIVDDFQKAGLKIFGPNKKAAKIEWSKSFSKNFMKQHNIPTAAYQTFKNYADALDYATRQKFPLVIKDSGLALGKGVFICQDQNEAESTLASLMKDNKLGSAGQEVVIEEFLDGVEYSAHAICDGDNFVLFPLAQDHKRIGENNTGSNTGGMGTICPIPIEDGGARRIVAATLSGLGAENISFAGCLFPGLLETKDGTKVLEYNARFGDPETQVFMVLMESDLFELLDAATSHELQTIKVKWRNRFAVCVVLASGGYPGKYKVGLPIHGVEEAEQLSNVTIFHSGTESNGNNIVTAGGRVLSVVGTGGSLEKARDTAYRAVEKITFKNMYFRRDIGARWLKR